MDLDAQTGQREIGPITSQTRTQWRSNKIAGQEWWRLTAQENFDFWVNNAN